jgi:hypothetical protein
MCDLDEDAIITQLSGAWINLVSVGVPRVQRRQYTKPMLTCVCHTGRKGTRRLFHVPRAGRQAPVELVVAQQPGRVRTEPGRVRRSAIAATAGARQGQQQPGHTRQHDRSVSAHGQAHRNNQSIHHAAERLAQEPSVRQGLCCQGRLLDGERESALRCHPWLIIAC